MTRARLKDQGNGVEVHQPRVPLVYDFDLDSVVVTDDKLQTNGRSFVVILGKMLIDQRGLF